MRKIWPGQGDKFNGIRGNGEIMCLGGCGGIVGIIPPWSVAINKHENWCEKCAEKHREYMEGHPEHWLPTSAFRSSHRMWADEWRL